MDAETLRRGVESYTDGWVYGGARRTLRNAILDLKKHGLESGIWDGILEELEDLAKMS